MMADRAWRWPWARRRPSRSTCRESRMLDFFQGGLAMTTAAAGWLALALWTTSVAAAPAYVAVPLGSLGGQSVYGAGINARGQVAGWADSDGAGAVHRHAFLYGDGTLTDLGTLPGGTQSFAYAVNDGGQVVGASNRAGVSQLHAVMFNASTAVDFNSLLGGSISNGYAIDTRGDIAGGFSSATMSTHAYRYLAASGAVADLGTFGGTTSQAYGINDSGAVTGFAHTPSQDAHAFRYDGAGLTDLGTLGGNSSIGYGINVRGHVVGEAYLPGNSGPHAFLHDATAMADLGTLGGGISRALAINGNGSVVGESTTAQGALHAFVYTAGSMFDLNTVTSGLGGATLTTATAVNDAGQIVAMSCTGLLVCPQAFRLDPVSVPGVELNQHGLTGSWYEAATSGQGFEIEVFPNLVGPGAGLAQLSWFTFDTTAGTADRQRWYTLSGNVQSGQPTASLTIYRNVGGNFNGPPVTSSVAVGSATLRFDSCASGELTYSFTDGSAREGSIPLTRITQNATCSTTGASPANADFALSGNWYDPAIAGQGFMIEVNPGSSTLFLAWYTYAPGGAGAGAAGQRWYTGQGAFSPGMRSIAFTLYETTGGVLDSAAATAHSVAVGSGRLVFASCSGATLEFSFTGGSSSGASGSIALQRVGPVPQGCAQ
jgi:probable HAF family extracellular repeat protein